MMLPIMMLQMMIPQYEEACWLTLIMMRLILILLLVMIVMIVMMKTKIMTIFWTMTRHHSGQNTKR